MPTLASAFLALALATVPDAIPELPGWHSAIEEARQEAVASDKYLLVDLYADWCGWCRRLEEDVFAAPEFKAYGERFVKLKVDVEDGADGSRLQSRYGVSSLPTTLILTPKMVLVEAIQGYAPREEFVRHLERALKRYRKQEVLTDQYLKEAELKVLLPFAEELHQRGDGARAAQIYRRQLAEARQTSLDRAWTFYRLADALRLDGAWDAAARALSESRGHAKSLTDSNLLEACDLLRVQIARDLGNCTAATQALQSFLAAHPKSAHRRTAQRALDDLVENPPAACT